MLLQRRHERRYRQAAHAAVCQDVRAQRIVSELCASEELLPVCSPECKDARLDVDVYDDVECKSFATCFARASLRETNGSKHADLTENNQRQDHFLRPLQKGTRRTYWNRRGYLVCRRGHTDQAAQTRKLTDTDKHTIAVTQCSHFAFQTCSFWKVTPAPS